MTAPKNAHGDCDVVLAAVFEIGKIVWRDRNVDITNAQSHFASAVANRRLVVCDAEARFKSFHNYFQVNDKLLEAPTRDGAERGWAGYYQGISPSNRSSPIARSHELVARPSAR